MTQNRPSGNASSHPQSLSYEGRYPCPVCARGQLSSLTLTEALACDFCQHIFTVNPAAQSIQVIDSPQPRGWSWQRGRWLSCRQANRQATVVVWGISLILVGLPTSLIALAAYIFPPLEDAAGLRFPVLWAGATGGLHGLLGLWLLAEYYQWPWYVALQVSWGRWR
jgi:hypothetical protein